MGILWGICLENIWKCEINNMKIKCSRAVVGVVFCVMTLIMLLSTNGDFV